MNKNAIVISRYNENINEWLDGVNESIYNIFVYNKGLNNIECYKYLDNVGRESHTYLNFIIDHYDSLPPYTTFLQGDAHRHTLPEKLKQLKLGNLFQKTYEDIGVNLFRVKGADTPDHIKGEFPIYEKTPQYLYENIIKRDPQKIEHIIRDLRVEGCFYVHKNNILRHSKETYQNLLKEHYNPIHSKPPGTIVQYAGTMEYSWHLIFDDIYYF